LRHRLKESTDVYPSQTRAAFQLPNSRISNKNCVKPKPWLHFIRLPRLWRLVWQSFFKTAVLMWMFVNWTQALPSSYKLGNETAHSRNGQFHRLGVTYT